MSKVAINRYYIELDRTIKYGGSRNEQSVRINFLNLLKTYAKERNYEAIAEVAVLGTKGRKVKPDGVINNVWGLEVGLWESKDEKDNLDTEIEAKIRKGYPLTNILFEDTQTAILFQHGAEITRIAVRESDKLDYILNLFFDFKSEAVHRFEDAIEKFKADIPIICETLRTKIIEMREENEDFRKAQQTFFELCQVEINPDITTEDIREMIIQHILTSDIFNKIFDDPDFHRHNTIAAELERLVGILFSYSERRNLIMSIEHYYKAIDATAAGIIDHHEKQKFLKVLYENFYKVYNPKAADRLGVIYTPNEIVQFMVRGTNYLLHKHFGKTLADKNVEILDPATGTGTYICDVIEHAIPNHKLEYKYKNEIYANEVAILPYYIANLNIEYTYKQKMECYKEFSNLCFVDTLDNIGALDYEGKQFEMFAVTSENTERIRRQNTKKISVIIGNPPYNANQKNENENNKNRKYPKIDKRIEETYIKLSTAQKPKVYDMYARFYRWASDRIDKNGIVAFITNNSFVNARSYDGFRKCVQEDFNCAYIIDLGGNIRKNYGKKGNAIGNVFDIQVGVAIMFLVEKSDGQSRCHIEYSSVEDSLSRIEKLDWLRTHSIEEIEFEHIHPDKNNYWINISEDDDWDDFIPLTDKKNKIGEQNKTIFDIYANGLVSNRDDWVYDFDKENLKRKMEYFHEEYNHEVKRWTDYKKETGYIDKPSDSNPVVDDFLAERNLIKWSKMIKRDKLRKEKIRAFNEDDIIYAIYRPFTKKLVCDGYIPIDVRGNIIHMFRNYENLSTFNNIGFSISKQNSNGFYCLSSDILIDLHFTGDSQCLTLYRYDSKGNRHENITDWAQEQFISQFNDLDISKEDIFHYVYGALHNPVYRIEYELNLKRDFPRIPYYDDFWKWARWGEALMDLHIKYETVEPFGLKRVDMDIDKDRSLKVKLSAKKKKGIIVLDDQTSLYGIPPEAWNYKLGNRSALEWILDQYKEKKPRYETVREKFNTYSFANYKEHVINLIQRVCTVSIETMKILRKMEEA